MHEITDEETTEMREILRKFFPQSHVVDRLQITPQTYSVLASMLNESEKCTRLMHLIPRPGIPANPIRFASKQTRDALRRFLLSDEGLHYLVCLRAVAGNYRIELEMASNGL